MTRLSEYYDHDATPDDFEILPAGTYAVKINGGEMKPTKKGDGKYLSVEMTIAEGEHAGRRIFDRFNLVNPNRDAVRIANSQFAALREAVGVPDPEDIADLTGIRFQVVVKCERRRDRPDQLTNAVQRYIKKGQSATAPQQQSGPGRKARTAANPGAASCLADDYEEPPF